MKLGLFRKLGFCLLCLVGVFLGAPPPTVKAIVVITPGPIYPTPTAYQDYNWVTTNTAITFYNTGESLFYTAPPGYHVLAFEASLVSFCSGYKSYWIKANIGGQITWDLTADVTSLYNQLATASAGSTTISGGTSVQCYGTKIQLNKVLIAKPQAIDNQIANLVAATNSLVAKDTIPPIVTLTWAKGATITAATSYTLNVYATDNSGGELQMRRNGGAWSAYASSLSVPLAVGYNDVVIEVKDPSGNVATARIGIWRK